MAKLGSDRYDTEGRKGGTKQGHESEVTRSFVVEAKTFIIDIGVQRGVLRGVMEERRKNFSLWVGMGAASLGFFLEGLERSFQRREEVWWTWGWEEEGRKFKMAKEENHAGPFVSLKVIGVGDKLFSICVPRGRKEEGGWKEMVVLLRKMRV